jgi:perosamine synthetase
MLVTNSEDIYRRVLFLRDHGRKPGDKMFWNSEVAYKYKMSSMQAALGLAQLERIEELIARKRETFSWYKEELSDTDGLTLNPEPPTTKNSYWMVTVVWDRTLGVDKDYLVKRMGEKNIDCRPFFHPLSSIPAYRDLPQAREARSRNHMAYKIAPYGVNLPSALNMTREKVAYVCSALKTILREAQGKATVVNTGRAE